MTNNFIAKLIARLDIDTSKILPSINQVVKEINGVSSKANKIQLSIDNGDYETKILSLQTSLEKLGLTSEEVTAKMKGVITAFSELKTSTSSENIIPDSIVTKAEALEIEMSELSNTVKQIKLQTKESHSNTVSLNNIDLSWIDKLSQGIDAFKDCISAASILKSTISSLKKMASAVYDIDTQMTELAKVSDATTSQLNSALEASTKTAKEFGASISDVVSTTADWSRFGYSLEDAEELAKIATIYKNIGDGIDIDTANKSLISTLQGFQLEAEDALGIIDKFNEVANNFPIDTAGIGEALQRSAASFYAANTDLSKSIALITGTNSVVQDPDSVGNMWKTVSMRIRGAVSELEEAGEDTDGVVESASELQSLIKGMTGFDIMEDEETFKDIYDIVVGIGEVWQDLTDVEQDRILETLAGKWQGNALSAALNNTDMIKEAYQTAENSDGSAMKEQEIYLSSLEAKTAQFQAAFQSLSSTVLNSDLLKWFVDFGTGAVSVIDTVIAKFGTFPTLLATIGAGLSVKNIGKRRMSVRISYNYC